MTTAAARTAAAPRKLSGLAFLLAVDVMMERSLEDAKSADPAVVEAARRRMEKVEAFALMQLSGSVTPR